MKPLLALLLLPLLARGPQETPSPADSGADDLARQLAEANAAAREIAAETRTARESGNDLTVLDALRALEEGIEERGPMASSMLYLEEATLAAELGDVLGALRLYERSAPSPPSSAPVDALDGYEAADALEVLGELAEKEQVVMINEAHHVPQHRAFTLRLLHVLRRKGFTHFAAETLFADDGGPSPRDAELEERGYPTRRTGSYLGEPVYADLVRTALALGYRIVTYEAAGRPDRELGQATRLAERVFAEDPDARLVVHAGYAHVYESGSLAGVRTMAQRFRELTGIDPLTIDQTAMTEASTPEREPALYRKVVEQGRIQGPTVFRRGAEPWSARPDFVDVTLFQPRTRLVRGRPDWLRLGGTRREVAVPRELLEAGGRMLVEARPVGEGEDAVPIDRFEIEEDQPVPVLLLPAGEHVVSAEDAWGERLGSVTVRVE